MSHEHDDYATEVSPGLPENLPQGERMLWQGAPDWRLMAWHSFHVREVIWYFAALVLWAGFRVWWEGGPLTSVAIASGIALIPAIASVGLLCLLAWLAARSTVYTITDKRLVMRFGIVLPMTFNLPFKVINRADAKLRADGSGDISVGLNAGEGFSFFVLWPHVRPWRLRHAEPTMRAIADGKAVAGLLAQSLNAASGQAVAPVEQAAAARIAAQPRPAFEFGLNGQSAMPHGSH